MHLKLQTHNLVAKTHTVKAGTFPVQTYRLHPYGLYTQRLFVGHPQIRAWQAHILPQLNLQICRFEAHHAAHPLEYYIDIVSVETSAHLWQVKDLYLDLGLTAQQQLSVMDTDELFEALEGGLISVAEASLACQTLHKLINWLGQHGNRLDAALASQGVELQWNPQTVG